MNIGFLLLRDTMMKALGELVRVSLDHGHKAMLFYDEDSAKGPKANQFLDRGKLRPLTDLGATPQRFSLNNLEFLGEEYQLDVLVTLEGYYTLFNHLEKLAELRKKGLRIVSLAHFFENIRRSVDVLDHFDKTYYLSQYAVELHFKIDEGHRSKKEFEGRFEASGSPMFDQLAHLDGDQARRELRIPEDKRVVVLFAPVITPELRWRHLIWGEENRLKRLSRILRESIWPYLVDGLKAPSLFEIVKGVREFCDRNNAFLIIKSRNKQLVDGGVIRMADLYFGGEDDSYFPVFTSYKLLAAADLCITAMSMSALEGVAAGVPVWNLYIPYAEYKVPPGPLQPHDEAYFGAIMGVKREGPFNFARCVTNIHPTESVQWFRTKALADAQIDPGDAREYSRRFLGIEKRPASEKILDSIETLVAGRLGAGVTVEQK